MGLAILLFLFFWFHASCSPGLWVALSGFLATDMLADVDAPMLEILRKFCANLRTLVVACSVIIIIIIIIIIIVMAAVMSVWGG